MYSHLLLAITINFKRGAVVKNKHANQTKHLKSM